MISSSQLDLGTEIACLHLSTTTSALPYTATILAVGLWSTQQLYLYQLPHLTLVSQTTLGSGKCFVFGHIYACRLTIFFRCDTTFSGTCLFRW
jgi:hypothetical protein